MSKTIVILLDGTSNSITEKRTNILRLYGCLTKSPSQVVYYNPGVGAIGAQNSWSTLVQDASEVWSLATGMGVDQIVKDAYRFLVETYNDGAATGGERDRICLFGFSRGAYTARMLAGFIHTIGLLRPVNLNLLDFAWSAYKRVGQNSHESAFAEVRLYERILYPDRPPVHLLGLFDTVASVIEPGPGILPRLRHHAFTSHNPSVAYVRHAVALDERRRMFLPVLWPEGGTFQPQRFQTASAVPQDAREVWFTGCHGDVGGGLPERDSGLAKIPLLWMIEQTAAMGLQYETGTVNRLVRGLQPDLPYVPPDAFAPIHETMTALWRILEYIPLPVSGDGAGLKLTCGRRRIVPPGARVHASVYARAGRTGALPPNVPSDAVIEGSEAYWTGDPPSGAGPGPAPTA